MKLIELFFRKKSATGAQLPEMKASKEDQARALILSLYGTPEGEFGPDLFVSHHLKEIPSEDWFTALNKDNPDAMEILGALTLKDSWSMEDDGSDDVFDFELPNGLSNYLLSVRFVGGVAAEIDMES